MLVSSELPSAALVSHTRGNCGSLQDARRAEDGSSELPWAAQAAHWWDYRVFDGRAPGVCRLAICPFCRCFFGFLSVCLHLIAAFPLMPTITHVMM